MTFVSGAIHKSVVQASLQEPDLSANPAGTVMALLRGAMIGETEAVMALLDKGVDANASDQHGRTALMEAAFGGHSDTLKALIDRGADVNARDKDGWTALMEAASKGHVAAVRVLLEGGADPTAKNRYGWTVARVMVRSNPELVDLIQSRLQSAK